MLKKKSNKKGFTIMEMLIVVAIIAVLAAIIIPTFSSALTKSKEAADVANIRAAYAEVQVEVITEGLASTSYKTELEKTLGTDGAKLNFKDKYKFVDGTITYTADKLNNNAATTPAEGATDAGKHIFTWKIEATDINN